MIDDDDDRERLRRAMAALERLQQESASRPRRFTLAQRLRHALWTTEARDT